MRVIFLDFDGVLHSTGGPPGTRLPFEWTDQLALLLTSTTDVRVVVHSSWREHFDLDTLKDFLQPISPWIDGVVANGHKGVAIMNYLATHPEITAALILDDQEDEFSEFVSGTLVLCNPATGISDPETQKRIASWLASS